MEQEPYRQARALYLDEQQPRCRCQHDRVSEISPGPVISHEILTRILVAPQHWNAKKKAPKAGALTDAERSGLSLFRQGASDAEIFAIASRLVDRARKSTPHAGVFGVFNIECAVIRSLKADFDDLPSYCVYDTAVADCRAHAEAFQRIYGVDTAVQDERRRIFFLAVESNYMPVSHFRGGLLESLAPLS